MSSQRVGAIIGAGRGYAVAEQIVVLAPGLHQGTFSGRILGTTTKVTGSFRC
jgi:hypothetical protein